MDKLEILKFITEQTKDPILALRATKEWEAYLKDSELIAQDAQESAQAILEPKIRIPFSMPKAEVQPKIIPAGVSAFPTEKKRTRFTKKDIFPNSGKMWRPGDVEKAVAGLIFGLTYEEIGPQIGRSPVAVRDKHACGELGQGAPPYKPDEIRQMAGKLGALARREAQAQIKGTRNLL
jgi:hypothetical protein